MYVLLYNVTELALDLDSDYAEKVLTDLHPNISVSYLHHFVLNYIPILKKCFHIFSCTKHSINYQLSGQLSIEQKQCIACSFTQNLPITCK